MKTWIFSTEINGEAASSALEGLTKARTFGGDLGAVHVGPGSETAVAALGEHGATSVFQVADGTSAAGIAAAMADAVESEQPDLIVFGMGSLDRDVAGRLSARLGKPVLANAVDVTVDGDSIIIRKLDATCVFCGSTEEISDFKERGVCSSCRASIAS